MMGDAFVPITPSSISYTGTSATIGESGRVTYEAVSSLSLNGVFTASYTNYMIVLERTASALISSYTRLRSAGTDSSSNYYYQLLNITGSSTGAFRSGVVTEGYFGQVDATYGDVTVCQIYRPAEVATTVWTFTATSGRDGCYISDINSWHNSAASYDGFTMFPSTGTFTGTVIVYGFEE